VVRLARVLSDAEGVPAGLEELAATSELDWLQLDYARPLTAIPSGPAPPQLPPYAGGLVDALRLLSKSLFLEPQLHIAASAGWDDAYRCVEESAAALVDGGSGELPVAAVRGSNLLPVLEMLVASGVDLRNVETGAPWRELRQPILAADLRIGAGPLATAMEEGARVIVAGCFDGAAPLTAAAVRSFRWGWNDWQRLAGASLAACAAAWTDWFLEAPQDKKRLETELAPSTRWVELHEDGASVLEMGRSVCDSIGGSLRESLERTLLEGGCSADVSQKGFQIAAGGGSQLSLAPKEAKPSDRCWDLEILYQIGFAAEGLLEFSAQANAGARRQIAAAAERRLVVAGDPTAAVSVECLGSGSGDECSWLHLACRSKARSACQQFVDQAVRLAAAHPRLLRFVSGKPVVHAHLGRWNARVPRDAVDIAVETRTAREWQ
jgi:hypothetical protein